MHSAWRVACVRIPRFPIGAVWLGAIAGDSSSIPRIAASPAPSTARPPASDGSAKPAVPAASSSSGHAPAVGNGPAAAHTVQPRIPSHQSPVTDPDSRFPIPDSRRWDDLPIALSDGLRIRAVTAAGARARIRAGMTVTEAESRCAILHVRPWDQAAIDAEVRRATVAFLAASPQVTPVAGAPGLWWIGASGLDALGGEAALAEALLAIARAWHPGARVAIADSCVAARAGTWTRAPRTGPPGPGPQAPGSLIIPPGRDTHWLASAPLGLIPMDGTMAEALSALGIRTAGGLAALPADDVEQRWGRAGLLAWRLARGEDRRRPGLAGTEYPRTVSADLVPSVSSTEPVLFLVRAALDRLVTGLVADGRAAATLAITLALDDARGLNGQAHTITREVRLAHPMARLVPLFERCRALLDRWSLPAPVCGVSVAIAATAPLAGEQGDLLDPSWRDPAAADAAFARLRAELGAASIVVPVAMDEHRPERAGAWKELDERRTTGNGQRAAGNGQPAERSTHTIHDSRSAIHDSPVPACTRQLEHPEPVDVECANGAPRILWWRGRRVRIAYLTGPERLAGDWWKDGYTRDYWQCEDPDGEGTLVLYHDYSSGSAWFVQGWHD